MDITKKVIEDLKEREQVGIKTYGETLKVFNKRSALKDAYEECLDLSQYLCQKIEEEKDIENYIQYEFRRAEAGMLDTEMFAIILLKILGKIKGGRNEGFR